MLVTATKRGYYKRIRELGDQFEYPLKKTDKMPSWMVESTKLKAAKAADAAEVADEAAVKANAQLKAAEEVADQAAEVADRAKAEAEDAENADDGVDPLS